MPFSFIKRSKWHKFEEHKPKMGMIVLFCNHSNYWIGKIESFNVTSGEFLAVMQDENNRFQFSYMHSNPIFWRYLPKLPEIEDLD